MRMVLTSAQMLVRISGVLLLVLGLLIWFENAANLIGMHMLLGLVLVISLWVLGAVSTQAGIPVGLAAGVVLLGLLTLVLGMVQQSLLPGSAHWLIQIIHLLVGMAAVGSGEVIGGRLRRQRLAETHP